MSTRKSILKLLCCASLLLSLFNWTAYGSIPVNRSAPPFRIVSGTDQPLTLDMVKNKVVVLFYETRGYTQTNRKVKDELNKLYFSLEGQDRNQVIRLPVINCSRVSWLKLAYKQGLNKYSKKEGMTIYGDWTGKMLKDYQVKDQDSNLMIIDKHGMIRFFHSGEVEPQEIPPIKKLVLTLLKEE